MPAAPAFPGDPEAEWHYPSGLSLPESLIHHEPGRKSRFLFSKAEGGGEGRFFGTSKKSLLRPRHAPGREHAGIPSIIVSVSRL